MNCLRLGKLGENREIIPILRGLQEIYQQAELRDEILQLITEDVNAESRDDVGREGFDYWQILVRTIVRHGCNHDYDKLQDLCEQHHTATDAGYWRLG